LTVTIDNETGGSEETVALAPNIISWTNNVGQPIAWTNNAAQPITWYSAGTGIVVMPPTAIGQAGVLQGLTIETNSADMALISMAIDSKISQYRG